MNKAYKDYVYNGFNIIASQTYNDWEIQLQTNDISIAENFYNENEIRFRTLSEAKEWTKTSEAISLKDNYLK